jgi:hypothetical protein
VDKIHESLRDLVHVFEGLAENAQAFMAGVARSIESQAAEVTAVVSYKRRLIEYLERFMGDLVRRSDTIARSIVELSPSIDGLLRHVAEREARDAAPDDAHDQRDERILREGIWHERWTGVKGWFLSTGAEPPQADLLRARARSAIPQLLGAIAALNERRSGRSDRSADFRVLARWFADCASDDDAHRLARAAFALNPARHFKLDTEERNELPASTSWLDAPPLIIHPRLLAPVCDNPARLVLQAAQQATAERLSARRADVTGRRREVEDEDRALAQEQHRLEAGQDTAPPVPYTRDSGARAAASAPERPCGSSWSFAPRLRRRAAPAWKRRLKLRGCSTRGSARTAASSPRAAKAYSRIRISARGRRNRRRWRIGCNQPHRTIGAGPACPNTERSNRHSSNVCWPGCPAATTIPGRPKPGSRPTAGFGSARWREHGRSRQPSTSASPPARRLGHTGWPKSPNAEPSSMPCALISPRRSRCSRRRKLPRGTSGGAHLRTIR